MIVGLKCLVLISLFLAFGICPQAKRIAIIVPEHSPSTDKFAEALAASLESDFRVIDLGLAESAYTSLHIETPFNQTVDSAKRVCEVVGCYNYILVKTSLDRRSSSQRPSYFEAAAFIFLVNGRTGRLETFHLETKQADNGPAAEQSLLNEINRSADAMRSALSISVAPSQPAFEAFDPDSKTMRPAMPYSRIKPEYTDTAYLFNIKATVEADVSIDAIGKVRNIDIVRWAGFGLDASVIAAINKMNWRPGERNGKPLPMRVLLRYNFTKVEKQPEQ
jgi:hypothetical protein